MSWSSRIRRRWRQAPAPTGADHDADPGAPPPGTPADQPVPLARDRLARWMSDNDLTFFVDNDGDVGSLWRGRVFYFLLFGQHEEILQVRGHWQREGTIERLSEILEFCNTWNTDRIWPKAYVRVRDDGHVHVVGEVAVDFEHGANDDQLDQTLNCGLATGTMLFDALDQRYPDPVGLAP